MTIISRLIVKEKPVNERVRHTFHVIHELNKNIKISYKQYHMTWSSFLIYSHISIHTQTNINITHICAAAVIHLHNIYKNI